MVALGSQFCHTGNNDVITHHTFVAIVPNSKSGIDVFLRLSISAQGI